MKFRKKPVEIEAVKLTEANSSELADTVGGYVDAHANGWFLVIPTLEGDMVASPGDWIIQGVQGEFYPCKPGIFDRTYEPVLADGDHLNEGIMTPNEVRRRFGFNA